MARIHICRILFIFLCISITMSLSGCGEVNVLLGGWNKSELEEQIKSVKNKELKQEGANYWCHRISLVQEETNKYKGIAYWVAPDGSKSQTSVSVTTDKDSWMATWGP